MDTGQSPSKDLYVAKGYWYGHVMDWFAKQRRYDDFNVDTCLARLEAHPRMRETAAAAFWTVYFMTWLKNAPRQLSEEQRAKIQHLVTLEIPEGSDQEFVRHVAYMKLHLTGILLLVTVSRECPLSENPGLLELMVTAREAIPILALDEDTTAMIDDPACWGKSCFEENLDLFSCVMIQGIIDAEYAVWCRDRGRYQEAFIVMTQAMWQIAGTTIRPEDDEEAIFSPYLPHLQGDFSIQEAVEVFEEMKRHPKDVGEWGDIQVSCDVIRHLGRVGLYDDGDFVRDLAGEEYGIFEYWGRASTYAEDQNNLVRSPFPVLTRDAIERVQTRERLKRDFLGDLWEKLEDKTRHILVDAEMEWTVGRIDSMVKDVRRALEVELMATLPFLGHYSTERAPELPLTRIRKYLRSAAQTEQDGGTFIRAMNLDNEARGWLLRDLPLFIGKVVACRNFFDKEEHLQAPSKKNLDHRDKAREIHRELWGVGCPGVLPRLACMKSKRAK